MREGRAAADGAERGGTVRDGAELGGAELGGAELGGAELGGAEQGGAEQGGAELGGAELGGAGADCAVLDWAASGAMALTGPPDGPPTATPAAALALLRAVTGQFARLTRESGHEVRADAAELIAGRGALAGFTRGGQVSAGGSCLLLRAADGWCAVNLSRPDDLAAVPAIIGALGLEPARAAPAGPGSAGTGSAGTGRARGALAVAALARPAADFAAASQLLGVPAAALPTGPPRAGTLAIGSLAACSRATSSPATGSLGADTLGADTLGAGWRPWRTARIAPPLPDTRAPGARLAGAVVADLSSMWAGPLCARLLGLAGADVIKVESPDRPDGARLGNREFFDWLHAGHRSLAVDFGSREGRAALAALLATADVVIEASRPRALGSLGLSPGQLPHPDGQVWLSITGYGQQAPDLVAFGDDAAVAGGLVGWTASLADPAGDPAGGPAGSPAGSPTSGPAGGMVAVGGADPRPVFCADAIADPLAGACGALAVAQSRAAGGGERIDLSMRDVAAAFAAAVVEDHGVHEIRPYGSVRCPRSHREQAVLPPRRPAPSGRAPELGADTAAVLAWLAGRPAC